MKIQGDIEYFDKLPARLRQALRDAPKPFSAKFAWQMLQRFDEDSVVAMLNDAAKEEIADGALPEQKDWIRASPEPVRRPKRRPIRAY